MTGETVTSRLSQLLNDLNTEMPMEDMEALLPFDTREIEDTLALLQVPEGFAEDLDEEAERVLIRALELKPEEPKTKEMLGKINFAKAKALLQDDRINEALEKLKASYSYNPDYSYTSYLLGYAYHKKENKEESIKYFEAFLQMEPNAPQASQVREILESLKK